MITYIDKWGHKRHGEYATCKSCGCKFPREINNRTTQRYCSKQCFNDSRNTILTCYTCGVQFKRHNSKLVNAKHNIYFCSRKCKEYAQSIIGNCKAIQPLHYGTGYDLYASLIEKSEHPKCIACGLDIKYLLCVHHIDGNRKNNVLTNLEIVCFNCHAKRHLKFVNNQWVYNPKSLTPLDIIKSGPVA